MKLFKLIFRIPATLAVAAFMICLSACDKKPVTAENTFPGRQIKENSTYTVDVTSKGALHNGTHDDTKAFNDAIADVAAHGGGTVTVNTAGTYLINPDTTINMKSNVTLDMIDSTRIIKVKASANERYYVIKMQSITNAQVKGGKILGERYQHTPLADTTKKDEHGMGIGISASTNCQIIRTVVTNCWGDGITVGSTLTNNVHYRSINCLISQVKSRNNRRQGLTIGGVDSLIVINSSFTSTNGTAPQAGIDIEPDNDQASRVYIKNCEIAYNVKNGIEMNAKPSTTATITGVTVQGNYIHHNSHSGWIQHVSNLDFNYNRLINNIWYTFPSGQPPLAHNGDIPYVVFSTAVDTIPNTYH